MNKGLYIVLEGPQGVGKTTQVEMLSAKLSKLGHSVRLFREPDNQHHLTARAIRKITQDPNYPLNTRAEVLLYNAARALSLDVIKEAKETGVICIADRNYLTTLAIQFYARGDVPQYNTINDIIKFAVGDNEPDLTLLMDAPVEVLVQRQKTRGSGERFDSLKNDFIEKTKEGYLAEAKIRGYDVVDANRDAVKVFEDIWQKVNSILKGNKNQAKVIAAEITADKLDRDASFIDKANGRSVINSAGKQALSEIVTNPESDVYSFTSKLTQITVAAAMARLSRRGDDMRITLLDEFIGKEGKDAGLIHRVVTAYGDDSVQQLVGIHMVVENASNLLTKQIEWGRLAAYLEQSTRYIYYDQKDSDDNYKYYVPTTFDKETTLEYQEIMDKIFDSYSKAVHKITDYLYRTDKTPQSERDIAWKSAIRAQACDAARNMLPVATKSTVGIFASGQALESLIMRLLAEDSKEAKDCGKLLLKEGRKIIPAFLERADKPERGGATIAYKANTKKAVKDIAQKLLDDNYSSATEAVTLTDVHPKNELEIVAHMLYEHTSASEKDINHAVTKLNYNQKVEIYNAYIGERLNRRHRPGRALERINYSWDIVCDYGIFRDLQRHRIVSDLNWQQLTPRYGYEIPDLVEKALVVDEFIEAFDLSLKLNSLLISKGYETEAQYATLMGHKMRWKITMNAREAIHFIELRTTPHGHPSYRKLVKQMYDKLLEVHPLTAGSMKFVNKDEDPGLTRLAAERYTQFKLSQLDNKH